MLVMLLASLPLVGGCTNEITSEPAAAPAVESEATLEEVSASPAEWERDLRGWLGLLESEGLLKTVTAPVTPDGEIQEIGRQMSAIHGPAVLFENIEGYENTWCTKLFVGSLNWFDKLALTFGLPKDASMGATLTAIRESLYNPIAPVIVDAADAPVKQNIIKAAQVDLFDIPVPMWHPGDAYRYINTWHAVVTKDPETGAVNVGCYRGGIYDKNHIVSYLVESQHWGQHFQKWRERGEDMPVAFVYGWDPAMVFVGGSPWNHRQGMSEWYWLGGIRGEAVPLVKCETVDLYVPATAEIVIEGHVLTDHDTYVPEAPLKEISGGYAPETMKPVTEVSCITHRDDPVMTGSAIGTAPVLEEQIIAFAFGAQECLRASLEDMGIPGILDLTVTPIPCVKIKKLYEGHAYQVGCGIFSHKASQLPWKMWVVVEEPVDIRNASSVLSAITNNCHPVDDVYIFPTNTGVVDAALSDDGLDVYKYGSTMSSKMLIDATVDWVRHPMKEEYGGARVAAPEPRPQVDFDEVKARWEEYGFGDLAHYED